MIDWKNSQNLPTSPLCPWWFWPTWIRVGRPNEPPPQPSYPVPAVNESWPWTIDQLTTVVAHSFLEPSLHPFLLIYVLTVDVIYVTVFLCGLSRGLWFIYVIPPSDHLHPSMKGIWLPLRDGFLQPVCLGEQSSLPVVQLTVSCCGTEVMDTNTFDLTALLTSHGRNCLERCAGLFFTIEISVSNSVGAELPKTCMDWNYICISQNTCSSPF